MAALLGAAWSGERQRRQVDLQPHRRDSSCEHPPLPGASVCARPASPRQSLHRSRLDIRLPLNPTPNVSRVPPLPLSPPHCLPSPPPPPPGQKTPHSHPASPPRSSTNSSPTSPPTPTSSLSAPRPPSSTPRDIRRHGSRARSRSRCTQSWPSALAGSRRDMCPRLLGRLLSAYL